MVRLLPGCSAAHQTSLPVTYERAAYESRGWQRTSSRPIFPRQALADAYLHRERKRARALSQAHGCRLDRERDSSAHGRACDFSLRMKKPQRIQRSEGHKGTERIRQILILQKSVSTSSTRTVRGRGRGRGRGRTQIPNSPIPLFPIPDSRFPSPKSLIPSLPFPHSLLAAT